jgi:hypothetical protein
MRFIDYLIETNRDDSPKPPAPRPKKTLWFDDYDNWAHDLKLNYPESNAYKTDDELIIALDKEEGRCYGKWDPMDQKGVTFQKPRSINSVIGPRTRLNRVLDTTEVLRKSSHQ